MRWATRRFGQTGEILNALVMRRARASYAGEELRLHDEKPAICSATASAPPTRPALDRGERSLQNRMLGALHFFRKSLARSGLVILRWYKLGDWANRASGSFRVQSFVQPGGQPCVGVIVGRSSPSPRPRASQRASNSSHRFSSGSSVWLTGNSMISHGAERWFAIE
jgi:hypothetical protein